MSPPAKRSPNPYDYVPERLLTCLHSSTEQNPALGSYCAGFELEQWRCNELADHAIDWIADYALIEEDLKVNHTNMYVRLKQAIARVYTSPKYKQRGEFGEILLHAICRDFFQTIPLAPRVFYLTASNDVVKSFDMTHVRYVGNKKFELWLGEAKFFTDPIAAINSAISSIQSHIDAGFLKNEKMLLGPQVSRNLAQYEEIQQLLSNKTSLDRLFDAAIFPVCITCDSKAISTNKSHCQAYLDSIEKEVQSLQSKLIESNLPSKIKILLIYIPVKSKNELAAIFDKRLKAFAT